MEPGSDCSGWSGRAKQPPFHRSLVMSHALYSREYSVQIPQIPMSNRTAILSTVLAMPAPQPSPLLPGRQLPIDVETLEPSKQRTRIWDLHHSLYCSIIGTCLTTAELRAILLRLDVHGAETTDEHGIHQLGVKLVSGPKAGAKQLQKALDRRHKVILNQCTKAKDAV